MFAHRVDRFNVAFPCSRIPLCFVFSDVTNVSRIIRREKPSDIFVRLVLSCLNRLLVHAAGLVSKRGTWPGDFVKIINGHTIDGRGTRPGPERTLNTDLVKARGLVTRGNISREAKHCSGRVGASLFSPSLSFSPSARRDIKRPVTRKPSRTRLIRRNSSSSHGRVARPMKKSTRRPRARYKKPR